jgi:hypothetical protein
MVYLQIVKTFLGVTPVNSVTMRVADIGSQGLKNTP